MVQNIVGKTCHNEIRTNESYSLLRAKLYCVHVWACVFVILYIYIYIYVYRYRYIDIDI